MTITWESPVTEIVWESQTAPGITWTTVVDGTGGTEIPARRLLPNTVGTPGQIPAVNEAGTAVEYVDAPTPTDSVLSVNGQTGVVTITAAGLGAVPTSRTVNGHPLTSNVTITVGDISGLQGQIDAKQATSEKAQANGYASLGADGLVPSAQLPAASGGELDVLMLGGM